MTSEQQDATRAILRDLLPGGFPEGALQQEFSKIAIFGPQQSMGYNRWLIALDDRSTSVAEERARLIGSTLDQRGIHYSETPIA